MSIYSYNLKIEPCPFCKHTDLELYENDDLMVGGGVCNVCGHIVEQSIPKVPSMHMLLDIWNNGVRLNTITWEER